MVRRTKWEQEEQWRQTILTTRYSVGFARHIKIIKAEEICYSYIFGVEKRKILKYILLGIHDKKCRILSNVCMYISFQYFNVLYMCVLIFM